ncbi:S26 family signal peptidase [Noviherbaspirillum galbum]|uniref:Signal peptidase I n=1 Tax=Noviherbaspirillum galbum TaxID=2709383 RepID=A0A6B3SSF5_9BURK|nr:S26 family signal peptidase [Noviherbaspirillum galbum]NEX63388.1 signal peptidase I [Noviherbaspirillum galbum]
MNPARNWTSLPPRNRRLALAVLLAAPLLYVAAGAGLAEVKKHGSLFFDQQRIACLPWGLYAGTYDTGEIARGELVAFRVKGIPPMKDGSVVVKIAAAREGDVVDIAQGVVRVNGNVLGDVRYGARTLNKPVTAWDTHYTVGKNEYFMFGSEYRSYDSRYWGLIKGDQIVAKMLWVL